MNQIIVTERDCGRTVLLLQTCLPPLPFTEGYLHLLSCIQHMMHHMQSNIAKNIYRARAELNHIYIIRRIVMLMSIAVHEVGRAYQCSLMCELVRLLVSE